MVSVFGAGERLQSTDQARFPGLMLAASVDDEQVCHSECPGLGTAIPESCLYMIDRNRTVRSQGSSQTGHQKAEQECRNGTCS